MSEPLSPERLAEIKNLLRYESSISFQSTRAKESMLLLVAEVEQWWATYGRDALPGALDRLNRAEAEVERLTAERDALAHELEGVSLARWEDEQQAAETESTGDSPWPPRGGHKNLCAYACGLSGTCTCDDEAGAQ
jgi:hypothetical protein